MTPDELLTEIEALIFEVARLQKDFDERKNDLKTERLVVHESMSIGSGGSNTVLLVGGDVVIHGTLTTNLPEEFVKDVSNLAAQALMDNDEFKAKIKVEPGPTGPAGPVGTQVGPPGNPGPKGTKTGPPGKPGPSGWPGGDGRRQVIQDGILVQDDPCFSP